MRKIIFKDAIQLAKIIKKANLKADFTALAEKISQMDDANQTQVGIEMALTLFQACGTESVEQDIYDLLNNIFECDDVASLSLEAVGEKFAILAKENNIISFFKSAGSLTQ